MTLATYKKVNLAISQYGVELIKGKGYHYFADLPDSTNYIADRMTSVMDGGFLRCMSLEDWIAYVKKEISNN
jgi:hypothetical protein